MLSMGSSLCQLCTDAFYGNQGVNMKTIIDAVNELRGEWEESYESCVSRLITLDLERLLVYDSFGPLSWIASGVFL